MKKVIIVMGEDLFENSYIIEVFDFKELDKIFVDAENYDCFEYGINKWEDILREDFKEKYCNEFDSYYTIIKEIIEVD